MHLTARARSTPRRAHGTDPPGTRCIDPVVPKVPKCMVKFVQAMHSKIFVNFSQISGQDPITFLRTSESCAVVFRISQNYGGIKLRIMVTGCGGSGSAAQIVACPFFDSPASSKGGAPSRAPSDPALPVATPAPSSASPRSAANLDAEKVLKTLTCILSTRLTICVTIL